MSQPPREPIDFPGKWILGGLGALGLAYLIFKLQRWVEEYVDERLEEEYEAPTEIDIPFVVTRGKLPKLIGEESEEDSDEPEEGIRRRRD